MPKAKKKAPAKKAPAKAKAKKPAAPSKPRAKAAKIECGDCPKGKRTGKASGLLDANTLCPTCEGSGLIPAPKKAKK